MLKFAVTARGVATLGARRSLQSAFSSGGARTSAFLSKGQQLCTPSKVPTCARRSGQGLFGKSLTAPVRAYNTTLSQKLAAGRAFGGDNTVNLAVAGASLAGAMGLAYYGYTTAEASGDLDRQVASRMRYTYLYLAGSLGLTAATARALFMSGAAHRIAGMNQWAFMGLSLVGMIGAQMVTRSISYDNAIPKHIAWASFCGIMGASLCPVAFMGGPLVLKAAAATGAIVSTLSLVGAAAPTDAFLAYGGPAAIGFGVVFAASMGRMWFPASPLLYNVAVYGGAGIFSFFVLYDTQKIMRNARYALDYDPINNCLGVYIDSINLFMTMLQILQGRDRRR